MNTYTGQFKNRDDSMTTVSIIPTTETSEGETELKFTYEEPVTITQESDGIFAPIKDKSCTLKIFTDQIYWDMYTKSPSGWYVEVKKTENSKDYYLFNGYMTPCIYSQDYAYKGELEIEAVDCLAVLDQFDYRTIGDTAGIYTVSEIITNIFERLPNYPDNFTWVNNSGYDFTKYKLQECNFYDDDDEADTCKEVLEQICLYFGITATMYNGAVHFIKYSIINGSTKVEVLDKDKYGQGTPTIELDQVYSDIAISCSLDEVDDITYDFFDDDYANTIANGLYFYDTSKGQYYGKYGYSWRQSNHHTQASDRSHIWVKPYYFVDDDFISTKGHEKFKKGNWKTFFYNFNTTKGSTGYGTWELLSNQTISQKFYSDCHLYTCVESGTEDYVFIPYYHSAYPIRYYSITDADSVPLSIDWNDAICFCNFGPYYWDYYGGDYEKMIYDFDKFKTMPMLQFSSDEDTCYSIKGGTSWITFKGDLWYQTELKDKVSTYCTSDDGYTLFFPFPFDGVSINSDISDDDKIAQSRKGGLGLSNSGFDRLGMKIQIGDKYFQGFKWDSDNHKYVSKGWATTETTFNIPYHDENISVNDSGATEYLHYYKWVKPVTNTDYRDKVDEDAYAIPITETDNVSGKLTVTIYSPWIQRYNPDVFMKDLEIGYKFTDDTSWAADEITTDDDIVYETVTETDYAPTKEDITLEINSWYENKPMSRSYILDANNVPVATIGTQPQEANLLEMYLNHYNNENDPIKKIFTVNYKTLEPNFTAGYWHEPTYTLYVLDSYEMDVQAAETKLKLIEL